MSVPTSVGIAAGRAAGLIDFLKADPRYGKPVNQVLIDTYTSEGVHTLERYLDKTTGQGLHMDVDNFSGGKDLWGERVPRLDPPLRIGMGSQDPLGGRSAAFFAYAHPQGIHVFQIPGETIDLARQACRDRCTAAPGPDPCGCSTVTCFDTALFISSVVARYLAAGGQRITLDACNATDSCPDLLPPPPPREPSAIP